jgi:hypothetical protein
MNALQGSMNVELVPIDHIMILSLTESESRGTAQGGIS